MPRRRKHDDELLGTNITVRVSDSELERLDKHAKSLNVPRSDIFRGFIHDLSEDPPEVKDAVPVTVGKTPMLISRTEAKKLLKDLTAKLVA